MNIPAARAAPAPNPSSEKRLAALAALIAWMMMVVMTVPYLDFSSGTGSGADANPVSRTIWFVILGLSAVILGSRLSLVLRLLRAINPYYLLFLALAAASVLWSIDPDQTVRRLVRLAFMCMAFLALAVVGWRRDRYQQLFRPVLSALLFGSLLFGLVNPELAIHQETDPQLLNAWRGLFISKNDFGPGASIGFIFWLHALLSRESRRPVALLCLAAAGACLILSRSSTSLMATLFTSMAMLLLMRTPGSMRRSVPWFATALVVLILLYSMAMLKVVPGLEIILSPIPMLTGKDLTFTGRAEIWAIVLDHIQLRPMLGSGYSAYWLMTLPTPQAESFVVLSMLGFYPGSCHNGYLQILNDLGYVGLLCLLGYLVVYFRQSLRVYAMDRDQGALFLALLLQQAIINLAEPLWLNVLIVDFVVMSSATIFLGRALLEARAPVVARRPPGPPRPPGAFQRRPGPRPLGLRRLVRDAPRRPE